MYGLRIMPFSYEPAFRRGLSSLWPLSPGRTAAFDYTGTQPSGAREQFSESWSVERAERINIAGVARDTLVVRQTQRNVVPGLYLVHYIWWLDIESRVWIKMDIEIVQGRNATQPFQATILSRP